MDFKSRNPKISNFTFQLGERRWPFPFDDYPFHDIFEIDSPDRESVLFGLGPTLMPDETFVVSYLTESLAGCPMRRAFEFGEITWTDYWLSRPWLLRVDLTFPNSEPKGNSRYISPREMDAQTLAALHEIDDRHPLLYKEELLKGFVEVSRVFSSPDKEQLEKNYRDFVSQYAPYLKKAA